MRCYLYAAFNLKTSADERFRGRRSRSGRAVAPTASESLSSSQAQVVPAGSLMVVLMRLKKLVVAIIRTSAASWFTL